MKQRKAKNNKRWGFAEGFLLGAHLLGFQHFLFGAAGAAAFVNPDTCPVGMDNACS